MSFRCGKHRKKYSKWVREKEREGNREQKVAKQLIIQLYNLFLSKKEKENKKWFTKSEEMKVKRKRETGGVAGRV